MYRILKSRIETRYCVVQARVEEDAEPNYNIDYLGDDHTAKQDTDRTLTDRYIFLTEAKKIVIIIFDSLDGMWNLLVHLKHLIDLTAFSDIVGLEQDKYFKSKGKSYKVNMKSLLCRVSEITKSTDYSQLEDTFETRIGFGLIFSKLLNCSVDYTLIFDSIQLYFQYDDDRIVKSPGLFPSGVKCITQGPVCISTGNHVQMVIRASSNELSHVNNLISGTRVKTAERSAPQESCDESVISKQLSTLDINHVSDKSETKTKDSPLRADCKQVPAAKGGKRGGRKNKSPSIEAQECKYKFYAGLVSQDDLNAFVEELRMILLHDLPVIYLEEFRHWYFLNAMCVSIGDEYDNMDTMYELFDKASARSTQNYNKEGNLKYWNDCSYKIHIRYVYTLLVKSGNLYFTYDDEDSNMLEKVISVLLSLYNFKYVKCINRLVYREEQSHYKECSDDELKRLFYGLYRVSMTSFKTFVQNLIYNIEARVECIRENIYEYKDIIPFSNGIFDLKLREFRCYAPNDYILYDVGYEFPRVRYLESRSNYAEFVSSSECLRHISEMFIDKYEERMFWQAMSENIDRRCKYDSIILFFGSKSNGKGSIFSLNSFAFGRSLDISVGTKYLEHRKSTGGEPEFYKLLYAMFATIPDYTNVEMCSDRLKMTSSGDQMTFRMLYSNEYIQFLPAYTTVIGCNTLPRFTMYDGGIRRRLVIIPFRVAFSAASKAQSRKGDIFRIADPSIRERFRTRCDWRDDYILNLIHTYYMPRIEYKCDQQLSLLDAVNNRFLAYLFDSYKINDESRETYKIDTIVNEYQSYLLRNGARPIVCRKRIEEVLISFDIIYNVQTCTIEGLERILSD